MKKICLYILSLVIIMTLSLPSYAVDLRDTTKSEPDNANITTFVGDDGEIYEYIQYSSPATYEYDGTTHTVLGKVRHQQSNTGISTHDNYHEWTEWVIVDYGIVSPWMYMSLPYHVASVARGETRERTVTKTVSLAIKAGIDIPSGSQSAVNKALSALEDFSINASGVYTKTIKITLTGPGDNSNYNTRTFYYRTGYNKHNITVIEQLKSNWDGVIWENPHENCFGYEPIVKSYSEDENV